MNFLNRAGLGPFPRFGHGCEARNAVHKPRGSGSWNSNGDMVDRRIQTSTPIASALSIETTAHRNRKVAVRRMARNPLLGSPQDLDIDRTELIMRRIESARFRQIGLCCDRPAAVLALHMHSLSGTYGPARGIWAAARVFSSTASAMAFP